jgi:hypothetical protein
MKDTNSTAFVKKQTPSPYRRLAVERRLSESSQNQAICALVFLYETVLVEELGPDHLGEIRAMRSTRPKTLPTVLSTAEVARLLASVPETSEAGVMARLLYGTGMGRAPSTGSGQAPSTVGREGATGRGREGQWLPHLTLTNIVLTLHRRQSVRTFRAPVGRR